MRSDSCGLLLLASMSLIGQQVNDTIDLLGKSANIMTKNLRAKKRTNGRHDWSDANLIRAVLLGTILMNGYSDIRS